jgi:hypothetical protein
MSLVLEFVLIMFTLTPVKSYTFQIILFPLQLYTYFFEYLTQSCLGITYIPNSTSPFRMKLAFLAQKIFLDLVLLSFAEEGVVLYRTISRKNNSLSGIGTAQRKDKYHKTTQQISTYLMKVTKL